MRQTRRRAALRSLTAGWAQWQQRRSRRGRINLARAGQKIRTVEQWIVRAPTHRCVMPLDSPIDEKYVR